MYYMGSIDVEPPQPFKCFQHEELSSEPPKNINVKNSSKFMFRNMFNSSLPNEYVTFLRNITRTRSYHCSLVLKKLEKGLLEKIKIDNNLKSNLCNRTTMG